MDQYGTDVFSDVPNCLETSGCPKPPQFLSVLAQWALLSLYLALTWYSFCLFFPFICRLQLETVGLIIIDFTGGQCMWFLVLTLSLDLGPRISHLNMQHFNILIDKAEMSPIFSKILEFLILISCHCKFSPYHSCLITVFHYLSSMTFRWMAMFPFCFNNDKWLYDILF